MTETSGKTLFKRFDDLPGKTFNGEVCSAKILEITKNPETGTVITTFALRYPRFIHSQLMTHRMFSRNSASSRAVPTRKFLRDIESNPASPVTYKENQPGMAGGDVILDRKMLYHGRRLGPDELWGLSSKISLEIAETFYDNGFHKEITNRILEPYMWMQTVLTATNFSNFYDLRLEDDSQPEIQDLANAMQRAHSDAYESKTITSSYYHIPMLTHAEKTLLKSGLPKSKVVEYMLFSAARCARVSYVNHGSSRIDYTKDITLAEMLAKSRHMTPFEHQAAAIKLITYDYAESASSIKSLFIRYPYVTSIDRELDLYSGNFKDWYQFRKIVDLTGYKGRDKSVLCGRDFPEAVE